MAWVATGAIVGSALVGGYFANQASQNAADTQANAANHASDVSMAQYNQTRQDQMPWLQSGASALSQLNQQMPDLTRTFSPADFQTDPGYQFTMSEGQKAIERAASAKGGSNSGATMKALMGYNQNLASGQYQNAYDRFNNDRTQRFNKLASLAGVGQTAANTLATTGANTANAIGQNITSAGNAQAAGQIGSANAINGTIGQGMNTWLGYQYMNQLKPTVPTYNAFNDAAMTGANVGASVPYGSPSAGYGPANGYGSSGGTYGDYSNFV